MTSDTPLQQLLRALVRFWWVALLGIVLAGLAFTFATYTVKLGFPPKLTARAQSTYSASTQLLVTSKGEPNLSSTNVNAKIIKLPDSTTTSTTGAHGHRQQNSTYDSGSGADGDLQRLVEIANNLPPRVTSDHGHQAAQPAVRAHQRHRDRRQPVRLLGRRRLPQGPLPYIKITGTADSPQDAIDITNQTAHRVQARGSRARQDDDKIKNRGDRRAGQQRRARAFANGGSKPLLGVAAALLVLLGGAGLVLALDRLIPRRRPARPAPPSRPSASSRRRSAGARSARRCTPSRRCRRSRCRR